MAQMLVADELDRLTIRRVRAWHWLVARYRGASLDQELIDGMSPEECAYLAARALQLTSPRTRQSLAAGLDRLLADRPPAAISPALPVRRASVALAAAELRSLRDRLLAPGPLPARGVAMVHELLSDGAGPVYQGGAGVRDAADVRGVARRALAALVA
jgi:hypothetical protein